MFRTSMAVEIVPGPRSGWRKRRYRCVVQHTVETGAVEGSTFLPEMAPANGGVTFA